ncbi:MAG: hypothetical protein B7X57_08060 [Erythrobacter sp. 34-65-8]|nr:MAG: hypothetical protein B7X57_08060 [Erythrobacter sp. 34-65-8]
MPRMMDIRDNSVCSLTECIEGLDAVGLDPRDPETLGQAALWLRRLGNNRSFLGDMLLAELRDGCGSGQPDSAYSPQSLMLSDYRQGYFLRANIWPGETDQTYRASGAGAFAYGVSHDHNFDFLTICKSITIGIWIVRIGFMLHKFSIVTKTVIVGVGTQWIGVVNKHLIIIR